MLILVGGLVSVLLTSNYSFGQSEMPRVLVFSKTEGYRHASIPDGKEAIQKLGREQGFSVDTTENAAMFKDNLLKKYTAVIFLSTTGDVLNDKQQNNFKHYIESGGGFVGIHSASDTEYNWPWYGKLVGAYFKDHPEIQQAKLRIHNDENFPVVASLPDPWQRTDEWYNFRKPPKDVNVLVSIDQDTYKGGNMNNEHPMVWYHDFDGGRSFYMELGHTKASYTEPTFLKLLKAGISYAMGNDTNQ